MDKSLHLGPGSFDFAGLVLAGGASSRMGQDKAQMIWRGRSLLDWAVHRLNAAGANPTLVSGDRPEHDCVVDQWPGLGPLGGLLSVLEQRPGLNQRLLLVMPVDTPGLGTESIHSLLSDAAQSGIGACFEGHPLPMACWITSEMKTKLAQILHDEQSASVGRLTQSLGFARLPATGHGLQNVNTPQDWQCFSREAG